MHSKGTVNDYYLFPFLATCVTSEKIETYSYQRRVVRRAVKATLSLSVQIFEQNHAISIFCSIIYSRSLEVPIWTVLCYCLKNGTNILVLLSLEPKDNELMTSSNIQTFLLSNLAWPLAPGDQNSSPNIESIIESRVHVPIATDDMRICTHHV